MKRLKYLLRNAVFDFFRVRHFANISKASENNAIISGQIFEAILAQRERLPHLAAAEFRVFSQWGEDGILAWLVNRIGVVRDCFVEFGVENFREANCRYLLMTRNWRGLVIDGSADHIASIRESTIAWKYDLQAREAFITRDTIEGLIAEAELGDRLGILSIDIDGVDYWVLERITTRADIIVVEYNDLFSGQPVTVPYDPTFVRLAKDPSGMYYGASLDAFRHLLEGRGYFFAGTNRPGTNAFFVAEEHADKIRDGLEEFRAWPCRMREVRNVDGTLALRTYRESAARIAALPLVNVVTGEKLSVSDVVHGPTAS